MPGVKCGGCGRFTSTLESAKCGKCHAQYHRVCVGVAPKAVVTASWRCPECKKHLARDNRAETPVRGVAGSPLTVSPVGQTSEETSTPNTTSSRSDLASIFNEQQSPSPTPSMPLDKVSVDDITAREMSLIAGSNMSLLFEELRAMRAEIQEFRKDMEVEMMEIKTSMRNCNARIDGLEARISALEQKASSGGSSSDGIVDELRRELNDRDQELLANDLEISNIPEAAADNPTHIAAIIGLKLGVSLDERDIVSAERVGGKQLNATNSAGPTEARPRPIVVRLARRDLRDQLLASARVRRGATTADLDLPGPPQRFFLNERLTKTNRRLFRKARDAASLFSWRFVWTKRGRILARKSPGDTTQRIRTDEDISRIFGPINETM
ncbi:uncharacterized protein LOC113505984 [Trichoplusia ni]|uniref:Uncharacterized protein LOC113505984 n=2 Tax=Trichoplusia ni TaxID=7111 RepID=A0A7E5WUZ1_TRINI|nr:uncharacterized protein LOC113505984 [Trichoplusia ni]